MSMEWTIIIRMPSGQYHVGLSDDPSNYIKNQRLQCKRGFFNHKANVNGRAEIVFAVRGDYKNDIKTFGGRRFVEMFNKHDPLAQVFIDISADVIG